MTDQQLQRIHDIEYSCDGREELAERIVALEDENERFVIKLNAEHIVRQTVEIENALLLELLQRMWDAFHDATASEFVMVKNELRELGVKVDG